MTQKVRDETDGRKEGRKERKKLDTELIVLYTIHGYLNVLLHR